MFERTISWTLCLALSGVCTGCYGLVSDALSSDPIDSVGDGLGSDSDSITDTDSLPVLDTDGLNTDTGDSDIWDTNTADTEISDTDTADTADTELLDTDTVDTATEIDSDTWGTWEPPEGVDQLYVSSSSINCALLDNGEVKCWGSAYLGLGYGPDYSGNLGDDEVPSSAPYYLQLGARPKKLALSHQHTCALFYDGRVLCWGMANRLGTGGTEVIGDDEYPYEGEFVDLGAKALDITAALGFTCAVVEDEVDDGRSSLLRCWGMNGYGNLGLGHISEVLRPLDAEPLDFGADIDQLAAVDGRVCVVLSTGQLTCWGKNDFGKLGYGHTNNVGNTERVTSDLVVQYDPPGSERTIKQLALGKVHTCALFTDGNIKCWGNGGLGALGYGNSENLGDDEPIDSIPDVDVGGLVESATAGGNFTCVRFRRYPTSDVQIKCWGYAGYGALGYGNMTYIGREDVPADVNGYAIGEPTAAIVAGGGTYVCAVTLLGKVKCWGYGDNGSLGYGSRENLGDEPEELPILLDFVSLF